MSWALSTCDPKQTGERSEGKGKDCSILKQRSGEGGTERNRAGDEGNSGGSLCLYIQRAGGLLRVQEGEVLGGMSR